MDVNGSKRPAFRGQGPRAEVRGGWIGGRTAGLEHYGVACSATSVATVRANQFPRGVSRALSRSVLSVSMPSRPRSATVTPEMGLSPTLADGGDQTPHCL